MKCSICDEESDVKLNCIPCGICGANCHECDSCGESRYVANDGEPSMFTCPDCRRAGLTVRSLAPCRAETDERRDVDEDPITPEDFESEGEYVDNSDIGGES